MGFLVQDQIDGLKLEAKKLGFLDLAPVELVDDPRFKDYLKWLQAKGHGQLSYMERNLDKRENPAHLGEHLKTAIVLLHPMPREKPSRWVARYAWGQDYHFTLKSKMRRLSELFQNKWGELKEEKICVDSVPIMERSLAMSSGLGWIGKNGCLIHRKSGSFLFLSVWLISLEYKNEEAKDHSFHCGTCTRCLDACPTQAFTKPGVLDAERCLSTQTIEYRNEMNPEFFPHLKDISYGCDICQDVCPWNRKEIAIEYKESLPPIKELLELSEKDFRDHFRDTAMTRPGWAALRRNFLISAWSSGSISIDILIKHQSHHLPLVRRTAEQLLEENRKGS